MRRANVLYTGTFHVKHLDQQFGGGKTRVIKMILGNNFIRISIRSSSSERFTSIRFKIILNKLNYGFGF